MVLTISEIALKLLKLLWVGEIEVRILEIASDQSGKTGIIFLNIV